ncbi:AI-2E family transporter [Nocardioides sp. cx-173]|uniref:AI-2E family transporter n=1 Tax=Nocardioides sp. cx-173 TaxID=2898796 RepID=UPI001E3C5249|nr:AI-2E family transporter [Nocardioides sp. cx-173]MCD4526880.1 AI-2E family transporter [Nocardioides sp. cx-173]UGB41331.1 AI-2E family transporter [Nocardioides sp. cx-173]
MPRDDLRRNSVLPRALIVLLGLAAAFMVISGMRASASLIGPAFLALVLTIAVHPLRVRLDRYLWGWVTTTLCVLLVAAVAIGLAVAIVVAGAKFATLLPQYKDDFNDAASDAIHLLERAGVSTEQIEHVLDGLDLGRLVGVATDALSDIYGLVSGLAFMLALVLFMTVDSRALSGQLATVAQGRPDLVAALRSFAHDTRRYLLVSTVFGLIAAVLDTIALELLDVPAPLLWGLLAFLTSYIPHIGFLIGLVPPAVLALLEGGPGLLLAVVAIYLAVNFVIGSVIHPRVVGNSVGLTSTLTFLSLIFWAGVIGPIGAILAVPLSILVRSLLVDADPASRWLSPLVANRDPDQATP